ncbi:hypothetical protein O3G_MSEX005078 [Manduca sexta]|uniref:Chitin-binding type-2 domain-containing protein n=1 Tax=Manduca sexta TaxID=7130 RepID=A0A921YZE2_MANSE|nr:hypothetical protein O3G_MSEX005078 [Manduca sexta]
MEILTFAQYSGPGVCKELNERHPVSGSCDRYIECINGTAEEKLCPDGLRFNPNVNFDVYPCQYPNEVACLERSALQPPQPTADCPHQFGYFKIGDARNCSGFRTCVNGVGYDFVCPDGLAFSSETYRCEWPDEVADCDAEAFVGFRCPEVPISKELGPPAGFRFYGQNWLANKRSAVSPCHRAPKCQQMSDDLGYLGFKCPEIPIDADGDPIDIVLNYSYPSPNCTSFFSCDKGRARFLSCDLGLAFDESIGRCRDADLVQCNY